MSQQPPPSTTPPGAPHAPLTHKQITRIVQGITLAMFLGALDQTIVATALPTIGRHFHNVEDLAWVVTAYLLTGTAATPLLGKLSDMYGRRLVMLSAVAIFVIGSVVCALAPTMTALIFARGFQGFGGGALIALSQTVIADIMSPRERGRYQGYIAAVFALSSIGGPVLGGILTEYIDWSVIFWINVPLGALALTMTWHMLKLVPFHKREHRLDAIGAALMMLASVVLLLALSSGGARYPWLSLEIGALVAASLLLWLLFAWRLTCAAEPFLPLNILRNKVVRSATLAGSCAMGTLVGMTIFIPLYFEGVMGLSASQSGVALIPMLGGTVIGSTLTGRALTRMVHYKRIPIAGDIAGIAALAILAIWPNELPFVAVLALMAVIGFGLGMVFPVSTVCMQNAVDRPQMGIATGSANFFRALVSALVVAILGAIVLGGLGGAAGASVEMLARTASANDLALAFRLVFAAGAAVLACGLGFILALEELPLRGPGGPAVEPH
ncbi:MDR family MFS transporter [Pseudolabrys sp. FHR47]|uniref:MDR family MFS transporter n=1 Tax=Pseudolabrys sp. FHR47 TaxID=2562284 RepID=UPI0010BEB185|nr:MDR family MFS transporter [Pseudolabrys sp. FHR47]